MTAVVFNVFEIVDRNRDSKCNFIDKVSYSGFAMNISFLRVLLFVPSRNAAAF